LYTLQRGCALCKEKEVPLKTRLAASSKILARKSEAIIWLKNKIEKIGKGKARFAMLKAIGPFSFKNRNHERLLHFLSSQSFINFFVAIKNQNFQQQECVTRL
jgi:hypothetical protein